jgi:hypothetical protein
LARSENDFLQWEQMILIRSVIKVLPALAVRATRLPFAVNDAEQIFNSGARAGAELTDRGHKSSTEFGRRSRAAQTGAMRPGAVMWSHSGAVMRSGKSSGP